MNVKLKLSKDCTVNGQKHKAGDLVVVTANTRDLLEKQGLIDKGVAKK